MVILLILTLSLIVALLRGGRIRNLLDLPVRHLWLFFIPITLQLLVFTAFRSVLNLSSEANRMVYFVSLALVAVVLWPNRELPGVKWIIAGFILNVLVISLNGGFMPVSPIALERAGLSFSTSYYKPSILMTDATILPWLGDILPLPPVLPIKAVFSIGDALNTIGGVIFIQRTLVKQHTTETNSPSELLAE